MNAPVLPSKVAMLLPTHARADFEPGPIAHATFERVALVAGEIYSDIARGGDALVGRTRFKGIFAINYDGVRGWYAYWQDGPLVRSAVAPQTSLLGFRKNDIRNAKKRAERILKLAGGVLAPES